MSPNDLDTYLGVLKKRGVASAVVKIPGGGRFSITFEPALPPLPQALSGDPQPGGWKTAPGLDNPADLNPEYKGSLP